MCSCGCGLGRHSCVRHRKEQAPAQVRELLVLGLAVDGSATLEQWRDALVDDAPASTGLPGVRRLVAWAPTAVGDGTFTVTEQASMTIPDGTAAFTAGTPLGLALGGLYVLE